MRRANYENADIFLLCYSLIEPATFDELPKWVKEVRDYSADCSMKPIILIGTKIDLVKDYTILDNLQKKKLKAVDSGAAMKFVNDNNLASYMECSALTQEGLANIFSISIRITLAWKSHQRLKTQDEGDPKKKCAIY